MFAIVLLCMSAIAAPAANDVDRNEELVTRMKERDPEVRAKTLEVLREMNVDYQALAMGRLKEDGEIFYRARIEVDGVNANNNTAKIDPSLFDEPPIQPSHSAQDASPGVINKLKRLFGHTPAADAILDIADYRSASNGEMTKRTRAVFADWKNREINEVVAHSWGCEAVYAAIVNGYMLPPKKLILTGVPDNNFEKWRLLAEKTGTRVLWVRAENDKVAAELGTRIGNNKSWAEWNLDWGYYCIPERRSAFCNAHGRPASTATKVSIGNLPSAGGHNRDEYYAVLREKGYIVGTPLDLRRAESAKKVAEIATVEKIAVDTAHREALKLVDQARAQALIARRDHDERLKNTYIDLARRFCATHGGVSQAELDALPKPYGRIVYDDPPGLQGYEAIIYFAISRGVKADALIYQIPVPIHAIPPPVQAVRPRRDLFPKTPFSSSLSDLKNIAVRACSTTGHIAVDEHLFNPGNPYSFSRDYDDRIISELSANLGDCSRPLFNKLVEMIRAGQGAAVTSQWLRDRANDYSRRPVYVDPSGGTPRRGGRCEDYGNIRCP